MPESFVKSYQAYIDAEWWRIDIPAELGGTVLPPSLRWAIAEMVLGSNPAVHMFSAGFAFAKVLYRLGTEEQKQLAQLSSTAAGAPRWCSPSPTPAPTSAPAAPRPSSSPTAPGTSPA